MHRTTIELTKEEKARLEYYKFAFDGMDICIEQFARSDNEYNEKHYQRLINAYTESYSNLQKEIYSILSSHDFKNIKIRKNSFFINESILTIDWW